MAQLKVRQVRSAVGGKHNQRETLRTLGLRRIGDESLRDDRPEPWLPDRQCLHLGLDLALGGLIGEVQRAISDAGAIT